MPPRYRRRAWLHRAARAGSSALAAPCAREAAVPSSSKDRSCAARRLVLDEERVELAAIGRVLESRERALLGDLPGHADEAAPCRARERAADTDAPHPHAGEIGDRMSKGSAVEEIHRLRRDRLAHRLDLLARANPRGIEHVRARG